MRVVICDDDAMLRRVVARLDALADHEVVAETDMAVEAVDLVQRFDADLLILDLALTAGSGKQALDLLRAADVRCTTIVFTAFASGEGEALLSAGAFAVVEKPAFDTLERAIDDAAELAEADVATDEGAPQRERRRVGAHRSAMPSQVAGSPSGLEAPALFRKALDASVAGDQVLVLNVEGLDDADTAWGAMLLADHRLAAARIVRATLRTQDRLSVDDDSSVVVLLVSCRPEAASSVFARTDAAWVESGYAGTLRAGWAMRTEGDRADVTLARATGALFDGRKGRRERLTQG